MASETLVNTGSENSLLPDGSKSLLIQCWLTINEAVWYLLYGKVYFNIHDIKPQFVLESFIFGMIHSHISQRTIKLDLKP